jgi:hypothetical protein
MINGMVWESIGVKGVHFTLKELYLPVVVEGKFTSMSFELKKPYLKKQYLSLSFSQMRRGSIIMNCHSHLGRQDSLVDKALNYRPKDTVFDPRLNHQRRST